LKSVEPIEVRRITVLVGRNSSGKSTFLRAMPLLRQSVLTRLRSPILWWVEDVDFGTFEGAVYRNDVKLPIRFSFGMDAVASRDALYMRPGAYLRPVRLEIKDLLVTIEVSHSRGQTFISNISVAFGETGDIVHLGLTESGLLNSLKLNGVEIEEYYSSFEVKLISGSICPEFTIFPKRKSAQTPGIRLFPPNAIEVLGHRYKELLSKYVRRNSSEEKINRLCFEIARAWPPKTQVFARAFEKSDLKSWQKLGADILEGRQIELFEGLKQISYANKIFSILRGASDFIRSLATEVMYIGPMRARSERFYRYQDLAVSQIDADGKNFPMFLNSLSASQLASLSGWVKELFGYGINLLRTPGHLSIELTSGTVNTNIVDTGYGVSQILPVLGQMWWAHHGPRTRTSENNLKLVAIEQPELHLHPAHQALLANALIDSRTLRDGGPSVRYLIETHSEAFVDRLGQLISEGKIRADEVQVLLFDEDKSDSTATSVRVSRFGKKGDLIDWPYGFFQPDL
jgi:hypothetical protein